jgi:hypothetical protein
MIVTIKHVLQAVFSLVWFTYWANLSKIEESDFLGCFFSTFKSLLSHIVTLYWSKTV